MPATTIPEIELALYTLLSGATISNREGGTDAVTVFVDDPDPEEYPNRVYPSISILLLSAEHDTESEDSETGVPYEVSLDSSVSPKLSTVRQTGVPYRMTFQINTWAMNYALADRELQRWIRLKIPPRTALLVGSEYHWTFVIRSANVNERVKDEKIYHHAWTIEVLADLEDTDTDEQRKQVNEIHLRTGLFRTGLIDGSVGMSDIETLNTGANPAPPLVTTPLDADGNPVEDAEDAEFFIDREIVYDDTTVTVS